MVSVVSLDLKNNEYLFNKRLSRIRILSSFYNINKPKVFYTYEQWSIGIYNL